MMLSKFRALPPKWAIDERIRLACTEQKIERCVSILVEVGYTASARRLSCDLVAINHEKAKLEKRIREILIHGHINQRARIQEQGY